MRSKRGHGARAGARDMEAVVVGALRERRRRRTERHRGRGRPHAAEERGEQKRQAGAANFTINHSELLYPGYNLVSSHGILLRAASLPCLSCYWWLAWRYGLSRGWCGGGGRRRGGRFGSCEGCYGLGDGIHPVAPLHFSGSFEHPCSRRSHNMEGVLARAERHLGGCRERNRSSLRVELR